MRAMAGKIRAVIHGGPFDGQVIDLTEELPEVHLEDYSSGRLAIYRYALRKSDEEGVRHYVPVATHPKLPS